MVFVGGLAGTVSTNATNTIPASGTITVGAAGSSSSGFGRTAAGSTGLNGNFYQYANQEVWRGTSQGYIVRTNVFGIVGPNWQLFYAGDYVSYFTFKLYSAGNYVGQSSALTLNGEKYAQNGKSSASSFINYFQYDYANVWYDWTQQTPGNYGDNTDNAAYRANSGSGGAGDGAGYSGMVYLEYPITFAPLTSTTGTVIYTTTATHRRYQWTTSGSYVV
jgi:hypothetical protein